MDCWVKPGNDTERAALGALLLARRTLALLLHVGTQHRIHAPLIARTFVLEIIEHVLVDSDRARLPVQGDVPYVIVAVDANATSGFSSLARDGPWLPQGQRSVSATTIARTRKFSGAP